MQTREDVRGQNMETATGPWIRSSEAGKDERARDWDLLGTMLSLVPL